VALYIYLVFLSELNSALFHRYTAMKPQLNFHKMIYTHSTLDRADRFRKDAALQQELIASEDTIVVLAFRGGMAVGDQAVGGPVMAPLPASAIQKLSSNHNFLFLGQIDEKPVFAISLADLSEAELTKYLQAAEQHHTKLSNLRFDDLRVVGPALEHNEGALLAYARGLVYWNDTTRFCSHCGCKLVSTSAGHAKNCSDEECNQLMFPRTDPAVIMLVTQAAKNGSPALCLLGRNKAWPAGVFSTLAGFVETGESLEQAVQREVFEEANIKTEDVTYIASQPWPFPRSIMLGFEARATTSEITCDPDELEDAQWFSAEQLKTFGTWGDSNYEFQLPRPDSIARFLINRWIDANA